MESALGQISFEEMPGADLPPFRKTCCQRFSGNLSSHSTSIGLTLQKAGG